MNIIVLQRKHETGGYLELGGWSSRRNMEIQKESCQLEVHVTDCHPQRIRWPIHGHITQYDMLPIRAKSRPPNDCNKSKQEIASVWES